MFSKRNENLYSDHFSDHSKETKRVPQTRASNTENHISFQQTFCNTLSCK